MDTIEYHDICPDEIDLIQPLWEELNHHHMNLTVHFKNWFKTGIFKERKKSLLVNNKRLKIWLAEDIGIRKAIGYCISSIDGKDGEIDSIFVSDAYRGKNIGQELMNRSLAWLHQSDIENITISVLYGNENALPFYEKFGFVPRTYNLKKKL